MMDRATQLANAAIAETQALRRENQGLKNQMSALDRRIRALEGTVPDVPRFEKPDVQYPHHVAGTTGRGIRYRLSDGSEINAGKVKALAAEDALKATAQ